MKKLLYIVAAMALFLGTVRAGEERRVLFTEKELEAGGGCAAFSREGVYYCRVDIEYVADKPFSLVVKAPRNPFMGLWRRKLPASREPRRETCDFALVIAPDNLEFRVEGGGERTIRRLAVESIPHAEYVSATTIPDPLRKGAPRHAQIKKAYAAAPRNPVVLFGDSLTDNWRGARFAYMATNFPVVNAGICGDRIEHLLWRIEDMSGLLASNPPSVATFLIGTNNLKLGTTAEDILLGVRRLVKTLRTTCPETKIIVFAIPPRAFPWRKRHLDFTDCANILLSTFAPCRGKEDKGVSFFDFSPLLLDADGVLIRPEYYENDALHFSDKGYAEVVTPFVAGAIRLVTAKNLPPGYIAQMGDWAMYLKGRFYDADYHFALEEQLAFETHHAALPAHWMKVFAKLAADPGYTPEMPDEYLRMEREEGLPDAFRQSISGNSE